MELLVGEVEEINWSQLKDQRIGLMYDAWTQNGYHFVATYAVTPPLNPTSVMTSRQHFLLSFEPLETPDFGANAIIDHFDSVLDRYGISLDQLCCFIGDNASVNVAISRRLDIPLVGCASYRLHLAAEAHMAPVKPMIEKVSAVMKYLRHSKQKTALRETNALMPILSNDTRWSSAFQMIKRYLEMCPHLNVDDDDLVPLLLSPGEKQQLRLMYDDLRKFESVNKKLQHSNHITLRHVRILFDGLLSDFPRCKRHLATDARVVSFPHFESAIVQVLTGHEDSLSSPEEDALARMLKPSVAYDNESEESLGYADCLLANEETSASESRYVDLKWIPPTSNEVERLFSQAGLVYTDRRQSLHPDTLELLLFLRGNRHLWDATTVAKAVGNRSSASSGAFFTPRKRRAVAEDSIVEESPNSGPPYLQ